MKKISDTVITFILVTIIILLVAYSPLAKAGAQNGIYLCEKIIIPSLLPVLIICNMLSVSKSARVFQSVFGKAISFIFNLPPCTASVILLGLVGGFPAGAILTNSLYKQNMINSKTAKRLMRFNFSGGAAFIVTALGEVSYGSKKLGIITFFVVTISELITAFITRGRKTPTLSAEARYYRFDDALIISANTTVKSLALMSAIIVLFSALFKIIDIPPLFAPLFEITNGLCSKARFSLPFLCAYLSFGGFCIHLQMFPFLREMKVSYLSFLFWRIFNSVLSFILGEVYLHFFPESETVFNNISNVKGHMFTSSVSLSLVMIIGCAVIVFDIENRKLKKA